MMYSVYTLNKQSANIQPWHTPFPIWTLFVFLALEIDIPCFTVLPRYCIFTNWELILTLRWTRLWATFFKNSIWSFHVSVSLLVIFTICQTFAIIIVTLVICNINVTAMTCWSLLFWLVIFFFFFSNALFLGYGLYIVFSDIMLLHTW